MPRLIVTAYGQLTPVPSLLDLSAEEDLYSVFLARSELMRWSNLNAVTQPRTRTPLWAMNDAELNLDPQEPELGWAQVGLDVGPIISAPDPSEYPTLSQEEIAQLDPSQYGYAPYPIEQGPPTDPAVAIPPLVQCLDDALRKFGEADVSAYRVEVYDLSPSDRSQLYPLAGVLNWFNVVGSEPRARAVATVQADLWGTDMASQVLAVLQQSNTGTFAFGPMTRAADDTTVDVTMSEWSAATAGWVVAKLVDLLFAHSPAIESLTVQLTRSTEESPTV